MKLFFANKFILCGRIVFTCYIAVIPIFTQATNLKKETKTFSIAQKKVLPTKNIDKKQNNLQKKKKRAKKIKLEDKYPRYFNFKFGLGPSYHFVYNQTYQLLTLPFRVNILVSLRFGMFSTIFGLEDFFSFGIGADYLSLFSETTGLLTVSLISIPLWFEYLVFRRTEWRIYVGTEIGPGYGTFSDRGNGNKLQSVHMNLKAVSRIIYLGFYPNSFWFALKENNFFEFTSAGSSASVIMGFTASVGFGYIF